MSEVLIDSPDSGVTSYRRPTYADIEALGPGLRGEIISGELIVVPRPAPRHVRASSELGIELGGKFGIGRGPPGGWWILDEPELRLDLDPDFDPVDPDLAGWRVERMPELPETASFHQAPDWVCEILSPSTFMRDRYEKLPFYARAGIAHAWIVDPSAETIEVYANDGGRWKLLAQHHGAAIVRAAPFDAHELPLAPLWLR